MERHAGRTVDEFDAMSPQDRADAVRSGIVHSWDDVDPDERDRIEAKAAEIERARRARG